MCCKLYSEPKVTEWHHFLAAAAALIAAAVPVVRWLARYIQLASASSATALNFLLRRGWAEAIVKGIVDKDGKVISDRALLLYEPFMLRLERYKKNARSMTDIELFKALEDEFGDEFTHTICPALGVFDGACIFIAMLIVRR